MDKEQKEEMRALLDQQIRKTEEKIASYREMSKPVKPENSIGRVSRMDAINNKSVAEAALRTAEIKLNGLQGMQASLDDEDFGLCRRCKSPIPMGRLIRMPQSAYCVRCAR